MLDLFESVYMVVLNCVYIVVGVTVATYLMPYLVGKRMIRGMLKAASEVFDEQARDVIVHKLGESLADPTIREFGYHLFLKLITDGDVMSAITGKSE